MADDLVQFVNFSIIRSILVQFSQVWSFLSILVHSMHFFHSIHFGLFGLFLSNLVRSTSFQFGPFPYSLVQIGLFNPFDPHSIQLGPFQSIISIAIYFGPLWSIWSTWSIWCTYLKMEKYIFWIKNIYSKSEFINILVVLSFPIFSFFCPLS